MDDHAQYTEWFAGRKKYKGESLAKIRTSSLADFARDAYATSKSRKVPSSEQALLPINLCADASFDCADFGSQFACGCLLLEARTRFGLTRSWTNWLRTSAGIPPSAAQRIMRQVRMSLGVTLPASHGVYRRRVVPPTIARAVFERDGWRCYLCGDHTPKELVGKQCSNSPTVDHVVSSADGGDPVEDNLRCACWRCNARKGDTSASITDTILCNALRNCLMYLQSTVGHKFSGLSSDVIGLSELQRLWATFVIREWDDAFEKESTALNDPAIRTILELEGLSKLEPSAWLEETRKFMLEAFPNRSLPADGLILEVKMVDEGDAIRIERKKIFPTDEGFGGTKVVVEVERVNFSSLTGATER